MTIGISTPLPAYTIDPAFMARKAEELGFDSIWYAEHPAVPVESASPFPSTGGEIPWQYSHFDEPYIALARASANTSTIRKRLGVQRHCRKARILPRLKAVFEHEDGLEALARKPQRRTGAARVLGSGAVDDDRIAAR